MVVLNLGYTAPINRSGQSPVLTTPQVWAGLQRKVRHGNEFVPLIVHCEVQSEEVSASGEETITRIIKFKPGAGPKADNEPVKEVCKLYAPCRVDFHQEDGSKIANYISQGPTGEPDDLFLTYIFEWRYPGLEEGSEQLKALEERNKTTAKMAVESSIETIRRMVAEGKI
ncbi:hypothetical protein B0T19DRAFT_478898 [Cercophora scortea]|uniref:DUF1857-domain-containing protein n=1 Tax=Cercophora scortea TaxID=314031 RepID=A0AAE0I7E0_9PEZI|nr:hypothetical protein B0T19DRAFT_478898 [Cercophora scortea]